MFLSSLCQGRKCTQNKPREERQSKCNILLLNWCGYRSNFLVFKGNSNSNLNSTQCNLITKKPTVQFSYCIPIEPHWRNYSELHLDVGCKIAADGDCSHEIKRRLPLGRKVMTNPDSILKSRDITLPTKVHLTKAMIFPVVMNACESWTIKKAERQTTDAFELWCWRRLLQVPWTARRSNQSILKEINPEYSLEGLMLKLKLI